MSEEKTPTVAGLLHKVASDICNHYCKFPDIYKDPDGEDNERLWDERCENCPLNTLGL